MLLLIAAVILESIEDMVDDALFELLLGVVDLEESVALGVDEVAAAAAAAAAAAKDDDASS